MKKFLLKATTFSIIALSLIVSLEAEASTQSMDHGNGMKSFSGDLNGYSLNHGNGMTSYYLK